MQLNRKNQNENIYQTPPAHHFARRILRLTDGAHLFGPEGELVLGVVVDV